MKRYWLKISAHSVEVEDTSTEWVNISTLDYQPSFLEQLAALGAIELKGEYMRPSQLLKVKKIIRLRNSLGVNTAGAAIILDLLKKIDELQKELNKY